MKRIETQKNMLKWFSSYFIAVVLWHLIVRYNNLDDWQLYISKPLIVFSLLVFTLYITKNRKQKFPLLIGALVLSLGGDVLLLFESKGELYFILGLVSFLLAHVCYSLLFLKNTMQRKIHVLIGLLLLLYALGIFSVLYTYLEELLIPVIVYMSVITLMVFSATLRSRQLPNKSFILVLIGAILFMSSDSILALDKFYRTIPYASISIMFTYSFAQYFITLGILKEKL